MTITVSLSTPYALKKIESGINGTTEYAGDARILMQITAQIPQQTSNRARPAKVVDPPNRLVAINPMILSKLKIISPQPLLT